MQVALSHHLHREGEFQAEDLQLNKSRRGRTRSARWGRRCQWSLGVAWPQAARALLKLVNRLTAWSWSAHECVSARQADPDLARLVGEAPEAYAAAGGTNSA